MAEIEWKREFEAIGPKGVRSALIANRWEAAKLSAAREWLERADAMAWQATRPGDSDGPAATTMSAFRRFSWIYYLAGGAFGLLGVAQMLGHLF